MVADVDLRARCIVAAQQGKFEKQIATGVIVVQHELDPNWSGRVQIQHSLELDWARQKMLPVS
jgi:hypothetical protein